MLQKTSSHASSHSSIKELSIMAAPQLEMEGNYGVPLGTGLMEIIKLGETVMQIHAVSIF